MNHKNRAYLGVASYPNSILNTITTTIIITKNPLNQPITLDSELKSTIF